jgi:hypothetical protein
MGGDVWQWNEAIMDGGTDRGTFGSSWCWQSSEMSSSCAGAGHPPTYDDTNIGFRMASSVPEPGGITLLLACFFGLVAFAWRRGKPALTA